MNDEVSPIMPPPEEYPEAVPMPLPMPVPETDDTTIAEEMMGETFDNVILRTLLAQGYPMGLAEHALQSKRKIPIRYWVLDTSESMQMKDGCTLRSSTGQQHLEKVACTRLEEMKDVVEYHVDLAALLQVPTVFRLLHNNSSAEALSEFTVAEHGAPHIPNDVLAAREILQNLQPTGHTPLVQHVMEIFERIHAQAPRLEKKSQKAVLVIATDGLPTSEKTREETDEAKDRFVRELSLLQSLPVWIILRLCTNEPHVVDFYNQLDARLDIPIDVLRDFFSKSTEVSKVNPWLNYGLPLHRIREMGYHHPLFDLLDERPLSKDELVDFLILLLGKSAMANVPSVHTNWEAFAEFVRQCITYQSQPFNPLMERTSEWIDVKKLNECYGNKPKVETNSMRVAKKETSKGFCCCC